MWNRPIRFDIWLSCAFDVLTIRLIINKYSRNSPYIGAAGLVLHRNKIFTTVKLKPSLIKRCFPQTILTVNVYVCSFCLS